jgi:hypothetical protein
VVLTSDPNADPAGSKLKVNYDKFPGMVEVGDTIFLGRYLVTGAEASSCFLEVRCAVSQTSYTVCVPLPRQHSVFASKTSACTAAAAASTCLSPRFCDLLSVCTTAPKIQPSVCPSISLYIRLSVRPVRAPATPTATAVSGRKQRPRPLRLEGL